MKRLLSAVKRLVPSLSVATALAVPLGATWSIVAVNTRTGEVVVASATCLTNFDLRANLPVIVVGRGAGAAQSAIDVSGRARLEMYDGFLRDLTPDEIFENIDAALNVFNRQYGIVSMIGDSVSFSGNQVGIGKGQVTGEIDGIKYAIQGNVLTAQGVVLAAERFFREADPSVDLATRIMIGMERARLLGGDGRCSCLTGSPISCGAPPPSFEKAAHVGFLVLARIGDTDGICNANGCATGDYYLNLNVIGGTADPDPVFQLQDMFDAWRAERAGSPDHLLSTVSASHDSLPADGRSTANYVVRLVDLEGNALTGGGAAVAVEVRGANGLVNVGPVVDNGDGTYSFDVQGGANPGIVSLVITAEDAVQKATLYPFPELRLEPVAPLHCGVDAVTALGGRSVPFTLDEADASGAAYLLVASGSGTVPGVAFGPHLVPLNFDALTLRSIARAGQGAFAQSAGRLDGSGRAHVVLRMPPGALVNWLGRIDWAAITFGGGLGGSLRVSGPVGFDVLDS